MSKWHIFAGGELKDASFITISQGEYVICADRGLAHAQRIGIVPDLIVGDFDSFTGELPQGIEVHRSVPEKDDTDTMLAVRLAIERGADEIVVYGALGGRFDHTFANVQMLKFAFDHGCRAVLADELNEIMLAGVGTHRFPRREDHYISLFSYGESLGIIDWSGVKYPLHEVELTNGFPLGVSNEIIGENAVLELRSGVALVIISKKQ